MLTRRILMLALAALAAGAMCASAAFAAASLRGPTSAHILQKVTFGAHGLKPAARYALRIRRTVHIDGRAYRCSAYLSGPRRASGHEIFHGTVPDGTTCEAASGTLRSFHAKLRPGTYRVAACVPAPRGLCSSAASAARGTLHVTR